MKNLKKNHLYKLDASSEVFAKYKHVEQFEMKLKTDTNVVFTSNFYTTPLKDLKNHFFLFIGKYHIELEMLNYSGIKEELEELTDTTIETCFLFLNKDFHLICFNTILENKQNSDFLQEVKE